MNNKENPRKSQKNYPKQQEVSPKKNLLLRSEERRVGKEC